MNTYDGVNNEMNGMFWAGRTNIEEVLNCRQNAGRDGTEEALPYRLHAEHSRQEEHEIY